MQPVDRHGEVFGYPLLGQLARPCVASGDYQDRVAPAVVVETPLDHRLVRRALRACFVERSEAVRLGLQMDHGADVAEGSVHVDENCGLATQRGCPSRRRKRGTSR